ncbi:hypothetical protein NDU88_001101 [Pleurodeles waltl]|uniref:Uncharacterized protein n=1 Tax=Pleurodeles waltl TaxID=8319 RepID=A0AAV7P2R3_PLEWA|nr:hypothetical protein NDU88_001101 [Pleurodeles waltl]
MNDRNWSKHNIVALNEQPLSTQPALQHEADTDQAMIHQRLTEAIGVLYQLLLNSPWPSAFLRKSQPREDADPGAWLEAGRACNQEVGSRTWPLKQVASEVREWEDLTGRDLRTRRRCVRRRCPRPKAEVT